MKELQDIALITAYKESKDVKLLGELYERYMHLVYGVCLKYLRSREEAQDAVMAIFERLIDQLMKHEVDNFKSWLHVLSKNYCLMHIRSGKSKMKVEFEKNASSVMEYELPVHHEEHKDNSVDLKILNGCMEELSHEQRKCVELFFMEEKSYKQIEEDSGYELKKVKSYIQNGKRNLKNCMERHGIRQG